MRSSLPWLLITLLTMLFISWAGAQDVSLIVYKGLGEVGSDSNAVIIGLENTIAIKAVQFTLLDVPNDLMVTAVQATKRTLDISTFSDTTTDGSVIVIQISLTGNLIAPGAGPIAEILYAVNKTASLGQHSLELSDVVVTDPDNQTVNVTPVNGRFDVLAKSSVESIANQPRDFKLLDNYPNPFTPQTTIGYHLSKPAHARLCIYNALGQLVATLTDAWTPAGYYQVTWKGIDSAGNPVSPGVYLCVLEASDRVFSKMITYVR
jgi:hypothetical protein